MKEFLPTSLPERWQKRPLEDVVLRMSNGITKRQTKDGNGLPVSRIESISHGVVDMTRVGYLSGLSSSEVENYRLKAGDILFSHINSDLHLGKTAVFSLDSDTLLHGMNLLLIRVDSKKALPAFLHWLFNFYRVGGLFMSIAQHAVNQSSINQAKLKQLPVILPPLPEQRRIVAEIEKQFTRLDAGVAALRRVQANLKRYRAAVLKAACEGRLVPTEAELNKSGSGVPPLGLGKKRQDAASTFETGEALLARILAERRQNWQGRRNYKEPAAPDTTKLPLLPEGWTWLSIETIGFVTKLAGFEYTKYVKYSHEGDLAVIKAENAGRSGFKRTEISRIKSSTVAHLTRSQLKVGDLLMVFVGAGTGNVARVPDDQPYFLGPNIAMICVEPRNVSGAYLEMFLRSPVGHALTFGFIKAVAQPSLSMGTIRMIPVAPPPSPSKRG